MTRFRAAIRLIWSRSSERKSLVQSATTTSQELGKVFDCPLCARVWPIGLATVDHDPPLGKLESIDGLSDFTRRMFYGPQRVICQMCHKHVTAKQRKKPRKAEI